MEFLKKVSCFIDDTTIVNMKLGRVFPISECFFHAKPVFPFCPSGYEIFGLGFLLSKKRV